jgi:hypothetical protein
VSPPGRCAEENADRGPREIAQHGPAREQRFAIEEFSVVHRAAAQQFGQRPARRQRRRIDGALEALGPLPKFGGEGGQRWARSARPGPAVGLDCANRRHRGAIQPPQIWPEACG